MRWRGEAFDCIVAEEREELRPLLDTAQEVSQRRRGDRTVKNWRELVDAIDWRRVLERVGELGDELKGRKKMDSAKRGLARRMLGELVLLVHFAKARRGMDGGRWREEGAKRLAKVVEALSGVRAMREGLVQYVGEAEVINWIGPPSC
jgi:hypothetical protein